MESFFCGDVPTLTLQLKRELTENCDGSTLQPVLFQSMSRDEIKATRLTYDSQCVRVDELFEVIGDPCQRLVLSGDCSKIANIGLGMECGSILVRGDAGSELARRMKGGRVEVLGNCGDHLATNMRNGLVLVHGDAGNDAAGPCLGEQRGMQGGDCIVLGNIGERVAERMRRGILFIGGDAGDVGAAQMIAGTIIVMGNIGTDWARGMKRGSIILNRATQQLFGADLTPSREFELSFLPLIWRHLQQLLGKNNVKIPSSRWAMRQLGDRANQGLGEVLSLTRHSHG